MKTSRRSSGPWFHRFLVRFFSVVLGFLFYWVIGFLLDDIGRWPAPDFTAFENEAVTTAQGDRLRSLQNLIQASRLQADRIAEEQKLLRDSTSSSQTTLNQLLNLQRLSLEQGIKPTPEEQKAMADAQALFLSNQTRDQELNRDLAKARTDKQGAEVELRQLESDLEAARQPYRIKYDSALRWHTFRIGLVKLGVFLPLMLAVVWAFIKFRSGLYSPLVYATGIAVLAKILMILHEFFPLEYFKYVWIIAAIVAVSWTLIYLLRRVAQPAQDWLLKQYREAYESFLCPMCEYPIRRGPLKYMSWTRRSIRKLNLTPEAASVSDQSYTCPCCCTALYEECASCHGIRHSLLPACEHCGAIKTAAES